MLYSYKELEKRLSSDYHIKKALSDKKVYKIANGIYSETPFVHPLAVVAKQYPNAIFTMDSAFYYHGLTDVIPQKMHLAVKRTASRRYSNPDIVFIYTLEKYLKLGQTEITYEGVAINVYNKERMLIELVRNKRSMGFDYYKEIIASYRKIIEKLDVFSIEEYSSSFDKEEYIFRTIQEEVF
jgi:predicted transcriptional regulator of viral defense system